MGDIKPRASGHPSNRRSRILDEALILAGNCGYRGFSLKDLAERCDLTKQGVMHYFPTKDQLVLSLLNERDASIEADLLGMLSAEGFDTAQRSDQRRAILRRCLVKVIGHMLQTPDLIRLHVVLRAEAISSDHPARDYFVGRDEATLAWLAQRMSPFVARPESRARLILAAMLGLQEQWLQEGQGFDLLAEWQFALSFLLPDQ